MRLRILSAYRTSSLCQIKNPEIVSINPTDLEEFADGWRTDLKSGTMDKRKAVFRQLIDAATFDGNVLALVPNLAILTGTGVKVTSPRRLRTNHRTHQ